MTSAIGATSATSGTASTGSVATNTGTAALASLSNNFSDFLQLLMTQLQNQDPSSPMDSNQFTSELVQFSQVEQQINTNQDLTQMIQLTQASQVEQSASMLGRAVTVNSGKLSLQNGQAEINFDTSNAEAVGITVYNSAGAAVASATMQTQAGTNHWSWDGSGPNGVTEPDGAYSVSVTQIGATGTTAAVPFTVTGTATAVENNAGTVDLQMGGLIVPFGSVVSVGS
ncbi:MAG TPA: flagellar hook capping FlgD N-terminal domain-containing protein [Rhodopila sp.]|uniref:flagellar hook assembly protein FlgD n=1 Tax=Rhodopila sp. TaxID=2480087 RepID=UPI002C27A32E|nr:flagellar hook capping FlgD N-terminal domain-containing protein [Rhodopila sp.]HVY16215.1 flagellar hook capping FlgD N-terminal domain-containing protein [Rhodopila sp.]